MNKRSVSRLALLTIVLSAKTYADGYTIDKIYHPYVQPLEREVEWRMVANNGDHVQRLGMGKAVSDRLFVEGYLIGAQQHDNFSLQSYELEGLWQLTEQGEYGVDWGFVTELERVNESDKWEISSAALMEKEWGRWVGAANFWLKYEWGDNIEAEVETALNMQLRYRLAQQFEPAVEVYTGENTRAIGPVMMGDVRFGAGKKLHWESGVIFGVSDHTPDTTWRLQAEFEF